MRRERGDIFAGVLLKENEWLRFFLVATVPRNSNLG